MIGVYTISAALILVSHSQHDCQRQQVQGLYHAISVKASESECVLDRYRSASDGNVHDISTEIVSTLKTVPFVAEILFIPAKEKATRRIVQIANSHLIPSSAPALESDGGLSSVGSKKLLKHFQGVAKIEMLQLEQMAALSALVHHHGLKYVFIDNYLESVHHQRKYYLSLLEQSQSAFLKKYGDHRSYSVISAQAMRAGDELSHFRDYQIYREYSLKAGAVFRLLVDWRLSSSREKIYPIPLIEENDLKVSNRDAKCKNPGRENLEDRFVKRLLTHDQDVVFVLMDGEHNLSNNIAAINQNCEYIIVKLRSYRKYAEQPQQEKADESQP